MFIFSELSSGFIRILSLSPLKSPLHILPYKIFRYTKATHRHVYLSARNVFLNMEFPPNHTLGAQYGKVLNNYNQSH